MINQLNNRIKSLTITLFPYTNTFGAARSILALGTLLTLLFNPIGNLMHRYTDNTVINPLLIDITSINKLNFFILFGFEYVGLMKVIAVFILAAVISGYFIRITSVLHWWVALSFLYFSSIVDGGDHIAAILTFLLLPIGLTDRRKNHWKLIAPYESVMTIPAIFSVWLIRLQVAVIYFHASVGKLSVPEWENGTSVYYWINHSVFGMPIAISGFINSILSNPVAMALTTYGVLLLEILLFMGLVASVKYRKRMLVAGLLFHFMIIIFHGIFSFYFSIAAALILFLYPTYEPLKLNLWFQRK